MFVSERETGVVWEKAVPGSQPIAGKYEYLATKQKTGDGDDDDGTWFYYLRFDPHGKPDGWYNYDEKKKFVDVLSNRSRLLMKHRL